MNINDLLHYRMRVMELAILGNNNKITETTIQSAKKLLEFLLNDIPQPKDENFINKLLILSNINNCGSAEDCQNNLEKIHELIIEQFPEIKENIDEN